VQKICEFDNKPFEAKRADARFCSPKHRMAAARAAGVNPSTGEVLGTSPAVAGAEPTVHQAGGAGVAAQVNEATEKKPYDREKNLAAFIKMGVAKTDWISTGIPDFDELTMIPRGRITQIQGPYGVGKTTLCLNMIRGLKGAKVLYIDSEASLNPELLVDLELDPKLFHLYNESAYFEDIAEIVRSAAKSGVYDLVIFDSLASVTTKAEAEADFTASNIGQKAKLMHKLVHLTQMDFKDSNTAFVIINQEREMIGTYVPTKYTPGGNAVPYAASLIVALKTIKSWRFPKAPKDNLYLGHEVEATIIKSKVNQPWRTKKFKLYYPNPMPVADEEVKQDGKESF
jgi:RecA/RadA recombinase